METNGEKMFTGFRSEMLFLSERPVKLEYTYADPWVLKSFLCGDSLGRVYGEHLIDEVFGFRSNCVPFGRWKLPEEKTNVKASCGKITSFGGFKCVLGLYQQCINELKQK